MPKKRAQINFNFERTNEGRKEGRREGSAVLPKSKWKLIRQDSTEFLHGREKSFANIWNRSTKTKQNKNAIVNFVMFQVTTTDEKGLVNSVCFYLLLIFIFKQTWCVKKTDRRRSTSKKLTDRLRSTSK